MYFLNMKELEDDFMLLPQASVTTILYNKLFLDGWIKHYIYDTTAKI